MSLADCIRKSGKALNTRDADAISSIADELESSGIPRLDAEKQAVEQHLGALESDIQAMLPTTLEQAAYQDGWLVYNEFKDRFLNNIDEDAYSEDVMESLDLFTPAQQNVLKAFDRAEWLGFEYPSQAISALMSGNHDLNAFDIPQGLKSAIGRLTNLALFQNPDQSSETPRGMIEILEGEHTIKLSEASDMSTFLHESMHLFVSMESIFARKYGVDKNQQAMLDHVGAKSFDELTVDQHETLAESFEVYLREGKAPSARLADAFNTFRSWLMQVYKNLRNLPNNKLDDELRGIFDRMLATEEAINEYAARPEYRELFRSKEQAGMTDAEWESYQENIKKRKNRATATISEKIIRQLRRRKTKEWSKEKAPLIKAEKERLSKLPVYQILSDTLVEPMDYASVKTLAKGDKKLMGKMIGRAKNGGIDPEVYAEGFGYKSAKQMMRDIAQTEALNLAADNAAEAQMVAKYGDILNDGSIESEVNNALHDEASAEILHAELKALNGSKSNVNRSLLRQGAKKIIGSMKQTEIKPDKYRRLEIKAALKAERATDEAERIKAKEQQIANHYLYNEATRVKADINKWAKYIDKARTKDYSTRQVDASHIGMMKLIANLYRNKPKGKTEAEIAERTRNDLRKVGEFYKGQEATLNTRVVISDPQLAKVLELMDEGRFNDFEFKYFNDLTADELQGVYLNLKNLRFSGGKVQSDKDMFTTAIAKVTNAVEYNGKKNRENRADVPIGKKTTDHIKGFFASLTNLRNKLRKLDGFDEYGANFEEIQLTVEDAHNRKIELTKELAEKYKEELTYLNEVAITRFGDETVDFVKTRTDPTTGKTTSENRSFTLHTEGRFMLALYWGTESSRKAVMDGMGITEKAAMDMMSYLTPSELRLVNSIWKLNEEMWSATSAAAIEHHGVAPPKLDPTPFVVNGVEMTGGHQTIYYDSIESDVTAFGDKDTKGYQTLIASEARSMKERVGSGGRKVYLSKDNITRAIDENIHYAAFRNPSVKIAAILNDKGYKNTVIKKHGEPFYKSYVKTIQNITHAKPDQDFSKGLAAFLKWTRRARTYSVLHYSIRNVVQQASALPIAMDEVGSKELVEAMVSFIPSDGRKNNLEFVNSKSKFMENRAQLVNREANEFIRQIAIGGKVDRALKTFTDHGFSMQTAVDSMLAYPTWLAKYNTAMMEHGNEKIAISQADTAVAESVGSGADIHLGEMFQSTNTQFIKAITQFGSWFNNYYQRVYRDTQGFGSAEHKAKIFSALVTLPLIVGVMNAVLTADMPEDDENVGAWIAEKYIGHMFGMIPVIRDGFSSMLGWRNESTINRAVSIPSDVMTLIGQVEDENVTPLKAVSKAIKITATGIPMSGSGQITRVLDYIDSDSQGKEDDDGAFLNTFKATVKGPTRN